MDPSKAQVKGIHFIYGMWWKVGFQEWPKYLLHLLQRQQIPHLFPLQWVQNLHTNKEVTE